MYGKSLLLRVFFESADGGYYSPYIGECFELLPVPEVIGRSYREDVYKKFLYDSLQCRCGKGRLRKYLPSDYVLVGGSSYHIREVMAHWDPRFDIGIYSDYWRAAGGRIPKDFKKCNNTKCFIFFAAGLAKYPKRFFERKHGFTEIRRTFMKSDRGIYVIAFMEINEVIDLTEIASRMKIDIGAEGDLKIWEWAEKEYGDRITKTPHYARGWDLPVIILSDDGKYGIFDKPIPLMEWTKGRKILTEFSALFGIRDLDDRIRHKLFTPQRTETIIKRLCRSGLADKLCSSL
jgi:hypothetical protein